MAKKIVKKTKFKFFNFLMFISFFVILGLFCYYLFQIPVKNIVIKNTNYINDDDILELCNLKDYPSFLLINNSKIKSKLLKDKFVNSVKIKKTFDFRLIITIEENKPLFFDVSSNKYVLTNDVKVDDSYNFRVPRLLNYVPDKKYNSFVKNMSKIDDNALSKISDIEYKPNDYDKDRFLLYMDDGNMVYLTLTKFKIINHYVEVLTQLENHKGVLYLDNGNHFKIME